MSDWEFDAMEAERNSYREALEVCFEIAKKHGVHTEECINDAAEIMAVIAAVLESER